MKKLAIVVAAAALGASTFGAVAVPWKPPVMSAEFNNIDGSKDGMLSFDEARVRYPTLMRAIFDMADSDDDGWLDEGEFTQLKGLVNDDEDDDSSPPVT